MQDRELTLEIRSTDQCNMSCGFCVRAIEDCSRGELDIDSFCQNLNSILESTDYSSFLISGGEPLVDLNRTIAIIHTIRVVHPTAQINLNTNGSLLTDPIVGLLNYYKVTVCLGFQALYGKEKSIESMGKFGLPSETLLNVTQRANVAYLRKVLKRSEQFATEVYILHKLFNCPVNLIYDSTDLGELAYTDLINLEIELSKFREIDPTAPSWLSIFSFMDTCDCQRNLMFADGSIRTKLEALPFTPPEVWKGCVKQQHYLGTFKQQLLFDITERHLRGELCQNN